MAMGTTAGAARGDARPAHVRAVARRLRRHPALRRQLDGRQPVALGPPVAEHADGARASGVSGQAVRRRRHRRLPRQLERRAVPALDAVRRADAVLPQPLRDRQRRPVRLGVGRAWSQELVREAIRLRYRLLPYIYAAFLHAVGDRRAGAAAAGLRPPGRPGRCATSTTSTCFGRDLLVAPVLEAGQTRGRSTCPTGDWYDWHTGERSTGGALRARRRRRWTASRSSPAAGAVIPMWPEAPAVDRRLPPDGDRAAPVRPARPTASTASLLQEDDGLTFAAGRARATGRRSP